MLTTKEEKSRTAHESSDRAASNDPNRITTTNTTAAATPAVTNSQTSPRNAPTNKGSKSRSKRKHSDDDAAPNAAKRIQTKYPTPNANGDVDMDHQLSPKNPHKRTTSYLASGLDNQDTPYAISQAHSEETPTIASANSLNPCCVNCAIFYSLYPGLVCCKPHDPEEPCLFCLVVKKGPCVIVKSSLRLLQDAAKTYVVSSTPANQRALQDAQTGFHKQMRSWRKKPSLVNLPNNRAMEDLYIKIIFEQQTNVITTLEIIRGMPRLRSSFNVRSSQALWNLNLFKISQLEATTRHLVGEIAKKSCSRCAEVKGPFCECVVVSSQNGAILLDDKCTNCAIIEHQCIFDEDEDEL